MDHPRTATGGRQIARSLSEFQGIIRGIRHLAVRRVVSRWRRTASRDIQVEKLVEFSYSGRAGNVYLCQIVADHVDAGEDDAALSQSRDQPGTNPPIALGQLRDPRRLHPSRGCRDCRPAAVSARACSAPASPSIRRMRLSPSLISGMYTCVIANRLPLSVSVSKITLALLSPLRDDEHRLPAHAVERFDGDFAVLGEKRLHFRHRAGDQRRRRALREPGDDSFSFMSASARGLFTINAPASSARPRI